MQLVAGDFWNVQFLAFNAAVAPFDKPEVRQAVQYAINKQNIADAVFYGQYTLGAGPIAPGLLGYDASLASDLRLRPGEGEIAALRRRESPMFRSISTTAPIRPGR